MGVEVATGDLLRALTLLNVRDDLSVRLALPAGFGELTAWRGCWETVVWASEAAEDGPTATVVGEDLRAAAADRPMLTIVAARPDGGLRVADRDLAAATELRAPPVPASLIGGAELTPPASAANPYAPVLADIDNGAAKVWLPPALVQRLRLRQISRVRLFPELGEWYASGVAVDETHLVRVVAPVRLY
jgi:hypothetical protein